MISMRGDRDLRDGSLSHRPFLARDARTRCAHHAFASRPWRVGKIMTGQHALGEAQEIGIARLARVRRPHRGVLGTRHLPGETFRRDAVEFLRHRDLDAASAQQPLISLDEARRRSFRSHRRGAGGVAPVIAFDVPGKRRRAWRRRRRGRDGSCAASPWRGRYCGRSPVLPLSMAMPASMAARCIPSRAAISFGCDTARSRWRATSPIACMGVEIVRRVRIAVGRGLDRVHERVDPGPGRERRRERDRELRIENHLGGPHRIAPEPGLGAVGARQDRGARRLRAGAGGRGHADHGQALSRESRACPIHTRSRSRFRPRWRRRPCRGRAPSRRRARR